jgi:CubicO group peptidase (beta-lactamase class C family)
MINPVHSIARAATSSLLHRAPAEISLTWHHAGAELTLDDYLRRNPTTGLLIAHDDTILFEHYQYGRTDHDQLLSQSMAKTVTAMLIGIALSEGAIRSLDQPASDYVSGLAGTAYGETTLRNLLHMASGVAFTEVYDGADDNAKLGRQRFAPNGPGAVRALADFSEREAPQGTRFHYASSESQVLGLVLANAVHMPLAAYLQNRIWQPMGAEADAAWGVDPAGLEVASCCLNAVLRDWARFALLLAHEGTWNGRQIIPRQWVLDATTPAAPFLAPAVAPRISATAIRSGFSRGLAGSSRSAVCMAKQFSSIRRRASCWCTRRCVCDRPTIRNRLSWANSGAPWSRATAPDALRVPAPGHKPVCAADRWRRQPERRHPSRCCRQALCVIGRRDLRDHPAQLGQPRR